jgi:hypothetical protein
VKSGGSQVKLTVKQYRHYGTTFPSSTRRPLPSPLPECHSDHSGWHDTPRSRNRMWIIIVTSLLPSFRPIPIPTAPLSSIEPEGQRERERGRGRTERAGRGQRGSDGLKTFQSPIFYNFCSCGEIPDDTRNTMRLGPRLSWKGRTGSASSSSFTCFSFSTFTSSSLFAIISRPLKRNSSFFATEFLTNPSQHFGV